MKVINTINYPELNEYLSNFETVQAFEGINDDDLKDGEVIIGCLKEESLRKCTKLKLYQHSMAGSDSLKKEWFPEGCMVCNATGSFGVAIAEWSIGALIYLMRNFDSFTLNKEKHRWDRLVSKHSIYNSTVLLLGMGNIGEEIGKRLKAMGAHVEGIRRHADDKPEWCEKIGTLDDLETMLPEADVIISCLPQNDSTRRILTKKEFLLMKKDAYFLNVGRGSVLDTSDLCETIKSGHLAGAALDVYEKEPLDEKSPLWDMKNVLISPHIAGCLDLDINKHLLTEIVKHNINTLLNGGTYLNEVDFATGYRKYLGK